MILRRLRDPALVRFVVVGVSNTALSYVTFRLVLATPGTFAWKAGLAQLVAYGVGTAWSFVWNRAWTFRARGPAAAQAVRFVVVQAALALVSAVLVSIAVDRSGLPATPTWLAMAPLLVLANFAASKLWVFR